MNKLTKIGASALCGSLAGVSVANAGDLTVSGGADLSWVSQDKAVVGQPIGIGSNYTLSGSGELENGWDVKLNIQMANGNAYSNTNVTFELGSLGTKKDGLIKENYWAVRLGFSLNDLWFVKRKYN